MTFLGDLGITARDVEVKLQYSFQLAQAWDCVLLLDEADIFLAERTEDISRNALVSGEQSPLYIKPLTNIK